MIGIYNSPLFRQMFYITFILAIIYASYLFYNHRREINSSKPIFITSPFDSKTSKVIDRSKIPVISDGSGYTLMFWMNIKNWGYRKGQWKHVIHKGVDSIGNNPQPSIWIAPDTNDLVVRYDVKKGIGNHRINKKKIFRSFRSESEIQKYYKLLRGQTLKELKDYSESNGYNGFVFLSNKSSDLNDDMIIDKAFVKMINVTDDKIIDAPNSYGTDKEIPITVDFDKDVSLSPITDNAIEDDKHVSNRINDIAINRWIHVAVVVNEHSSDVYIDGHLRSSCAFPSRIVQNSGNLYMCQGGGFDGMLTQVSLYSSPIPSKTFKFMYGIGPNPPTLPNVKKIMNKIIPRVKFEIDYEIEIGDDEGEENTENDNTESSSKSGKSSSKSGKSSSKSGKSSKDNQNLGNESGESKKNCKC